MKIIRLLSLLSLLFLCSPANAQENCPPEIGTNLGEFRTALVDIFKSSRSFWETDLDDYIWDTENGLTLDANGYPTSLNTSEGRAARTLIWEALEGNYPIGAYTLLYDGEGSIEVGMDAVNPVFTDNGGTDNRIVFDVSAATNEGIMVDITATTVGNHVHNIRIIRPDESSTDYVNTYATEPFIDLFYERHKYFKSIRFMDWMTTNWSIYSSWSDRPTWQKSTWAIHEAGPGVPVEVMVHVANRLQAHPWFCMPHRADDDYMTQFATYVRDNLNPNLKVSIEYSNEVWNGLFSSYDDFDGQHDYALNMGTANGITGYFERIGYWVARRSGEMFDIFETTFGGNERLIKVIPIQTGPDLATPHTLDYLHNGTPLHEIGDVVAGAVYFGGEYENADLTSMSVSELLNHIAANMYNFDTGPYWCLQTIQMLNNPTYQASELQFVAYEGGQHLANFAGMPEDNATATLIAANRHPQMGDIYSNFYDWWTTTGAGSFMAFTSIGEPSMFGAWGLLENIEQDTLTAPKWLATTEWIRTNQCTATNEDCVERSSIDTLKAVSCCGDRFEVTDSGNRIYFESADYLWTTDGTKAGTMRLSSNIRANHLLLPIGETFLFGGGSSIHSSFSIYKGDTSGVEKIQSVGFTSTASGFKYARVGNKLVFNGSFDDGRELWVTDSTEAGTFQILDIRPGTSSADPSAFRTIGNQAYFKCFMPKEEGGIKGAIWQTDGTLAGTDTIYTLKEKEVFYLNALPVVANNKLYIPIEDVGPNTGNADNEFVLYSYTPGNAEPNEVYRSGIEFRVFTIGETMFRRETNAETGTSEVFIWNDTEFSLFPGEPKFEMNGEIYYISSATIHTPPHALYKMGTTGPILLKNLSFEFGTFNQFVQKDNKTYFFVEDTDGQYELWETDGTPVGTCKLIDILADYLVNAALINGNKIVFRAGFNNRYSILCYTIEETTNTCEEDISLTGLISGLHEASATIITENETMISGEGAIFKAGVSITLTAGFQVSGATPFEAIIEDCSNNSQVEPFYAESQKSNNILPSLNLHLAHKPIPKMAVYPNPFSYQTVINYQLPKATPLHLGIYGLSGQLIKIIKEENLAPKGQYQIWMDANDLRDGLYILMLKTGDTLLSQKLVVAN